MSTAHIGALFRSAEKDRGLAYEMRHAASLDRLVEIGAARGYRFTKDELDVCLERLPPALLTDDEMNGDELEMVSAGIGPLSASGPERQIAQEAANLRITPSGPASRAAATDATAM
jgi:hypothetical protein